MGKRIGQFEVDGSRFRNADYELMRAIQKDMVVLDIQHNLYRDKATYTAEQIAARRSNVTITVDEGSASPAEDIFTAMLAADQFHTFAEWKRMGYSVKKGAKSAITCQLWKYTDKPGKAAREAAEAAGKDAPETDPHFYMAKAHLFHALQVEKSKR